LLREKQTEAIPRFMSDFDPFGHGPMSDLSPQCACAEVDLAEVFRHQMADGSAGETGLAHQRQLNDPVAVTSGILFQTHFGLNKRDFG
jgi:hypothetical protein